MTKIFEQRATHWKPTVSGEPVPARRFGRLLAASLLLTGCSLGMPEDNELFTPERNSATTPPDGGNKPADASVDATVSNEAGTAEDAAVDGASAADASVDAGDAAQEAAVAVFDPAAGLLLHYRFNESTGNTVHDFAGNKDAIILGTPSGHEQWVSAGRIDGALRLAGGAAVDGGVGHYVELPQGTLLGLDEATIALWMNRAGGPMWQRVFDLGNGPPVWIYFTPNGGTGVPVVAGRTPALIFVDFIAIPEAPAGEGQLKINKAIPVSTWVHVALTWRSDELAFYMDGKQLAKTVTHGAIKPTDLGNTGQNYLGRSQFAADPYFNGLLDEFRVYDYALSASDIAQLYEVK